MFLNPLGLLALLGVPAVVALHLFRRRFRRERVSALFLWESRTTTSLSGRRRDRLLNSKSFWAEIAMALLLGFAFAGPRACGQLEAKHLVAVLDGSASMAAGADEVSSPAGQARELLGQAISDLPSGSRVTVVLSGALPQVLIGPSAFPEEAQARLASYAPIAGRHDMGPAAVLAKEIAGEGAVTLYTDHYHPESYPAEIGIVALGAVQDNLGITRAARTPGREDGTGEQEVFITVANYCGTEKVARIGIWQGDREIAASEQALPAKGRAHFQFDLPAGAPMLEARLSPDALAIDNVALLAPALHKEIALFTDLDADTRRWIGLQRGAGSTITRWLSLTSNSREALTLDEAELAITQTPPESLTTWCLRPVEQEAESLSLIGPFLVEKRHHAVRGMLLDGVVWTADPEAVMPGTPLISAGDLPLLSEELQGTRRVFHLNILWNQSSLQRSPDWPILLSNLAVLRRRELDGPRTTNIAVGETFHYHATEPATYELVGPSSTRTIPARAALALDDLTEVGPYELRSAGASLAHFAVHFADDAESDLSQAKSEARNSAVELGEQESNSSLIVLLLGVLALCALLADWWFLRPSANQTDIKGGKLSGGAGS
jgi:hypothetical protein